MIGRRLKRMRVSPDFLIEWLKYKEAHYTIKNTLPEDTKVIRVYESLHFYLGEVWIVIESKEFKELPEGAMIPELEWDKLPTITRKVE